ncbi:uncharacterized protein PHACADRAFT_214249 [Phanerochaete carnosa HHB-10118-sp]|uniref:F-box domain-containing protein n=1 Tax=Phanerochaete carnosa (strain HHB-10118-sp) TaxID=650164 RepID=K5WHM0_PHACS|nr:uncharacterized protein PHACADRAFT_214249 [Phanerochaete carnosa HHB-10118-sp]EKM49727.1 hypothetical protein PHACADRAFT_214249 [Phanerochaete carnosa HHB-10118-sp]
MDAVLPEETLCEILSYSILVSHAEFFRFRKHYRCLVPRSKSRCGDLLLVSKRWFRIGTPLLYECVKLSKPEHTTAVANILRAHPHVGSAVRCLRLEGGLGKDLMHIAKLTPKLHSIYLSLRVKSVDSITGLKRAFPLLNPVNLYIEHEGYKENKKIAEARRLLYTHVTNVWTSLRSLTLSDWLCLSMGHQLANALAESSIEEFCCLIFDADSWITGGSMKRIFENSQLQRVVCRGPLSCESIIRWSLRMNNFPAANIQKFTFVSETTDGIANLLLPASDDESDDEEGFTLQSDSSAV